MRDIANIVIKNNNGIAVKISDIATIKYGGEIRQGAVSITMRDKNSKVKQIGEVVIGIVMKRVGANTKTTIEEIKKRLPIIQNALPDGVTIEAFYDQADLVNKAINTVTKALIEAFILIVIVLILFLMNVRAAALVLLSVPISIALALMAMSYWGVSANLMSLGGLAIAIGMIVDGSVVMIENIFKHLSSYREESNLKGIRMRIRSFKRSGAPSIFCCINYYCSFYSIIFS